MANWLSITSIPIFISADSPEELMEKMLENNLTNQKRFSYHNPFQAKDGKWIVWFNDDVAEYKKNDKGEQLDLMPNLENT